MPFSSDTLAGALFHGVRQPRLSPRSHYFMVRSCLPLRAARYWRPNSLGGFMNTQPRRFAYWTPRFAGLMMSAFLALFALDAFTGTSFVDDVAQFAIHLAPALAVSALVAIAWRFERAGAAGFFVLATAYAIAVRGRLDWVATISGPLVVVGILFLISAQQHATERRRPTPLSR
jgi:hypothetical protein